MICDTCHGSGTTSNPATGVLNCPACLGSGIGYCCEGERCDPDGDPVPMKPARTMKQHSEEVHRRMEALTRNACLLTALGKTYS